MMKKTTLFGVLTVGGALLAGAWLYYRNQRTTEGRVVDSVVIDETIQQVSRGKPALATEAQGRDYRELFVAGWSDEWLVLESRIDADELLCHAKYCDSYLDWLISMEDFEGQEPGIQSSLVGGKRSQFVELMAKKKLALMQAKIASRALGSDAGREAQAALLASVAGEFDAQIRAVVGEKIFSLCQSTKKGGVFALLAPFFAEAELMGFALSAEQENALAEKITGLRKAAVRAPREAVIDALLAFDSAGDESVQFSLEQVMVLRSYQNVIRLAGRQPLKPLKMAGANETELFSLRQWNVANFAKNAGRDGNLSPAGIEVLKTKTNELLERRISSGDFMKAVAEAVGREPLDKIVDGMKVAAIDRVLHDIQRKLRISGLAPLGAGEQKQLKVVLDKVRSGFETAANGQKASLDCEVNFLPEVKRPLVERHVRGLIAAHKLLGMIETCGLDR